VNIHDTARKLSRQLSIPVTAAYSRLAKRRKNYGKTTVTPGAFSNIETPRHVRLPYADL
jgi:hypothetical protein